MDAITIIREILRGGPIETSKLMSVCDILGITYDIYAPKCGEYGTIQKDEIFSVYQLVACNSTTRENTVYSYLINPREDYYYYNMVLVFRREDCQRVLPKLNKATIDRFDEYMLSKQKITEQPIDQVSLYKALLSSKTDWRDNPPLAEIPHYNVPDGIDFSMMGIDPIGDMNEKDVQFVGRGSERIPNPRVNTYHNNCLEMNHIFQELGDAHHAILSGPMTTGKHSGYKPY
jgi:hypothetical protein